MDTLCYAVWRERHMAFCALLAGISLIIVNSNRGFASGEPSSQLRSLQNIRDIVARNENLGSLVRMDYIVRFRQTPQLIDTLPTDIGEFGGRRRSTRSFTHHKGTWAQDGIRQYSNNDFFYSPNELARGYIRIIDGEVTKWGRKPDFMQGGIGKISKFDWRVVAPTKFGLKLWGGKFQLSHILVPGSASVLDDTEMVNGRETYVVDVKRSVGSNKFARIWIDSERGIPLRIEYFYRHPSSGQAKLMSDVKDIKVHQLPNGGWIPVEGTRSVYFQNPQPHTRSQYLVVDVNSITIQKEDIPNSLFTLEFPEGARVYNAITGIVTKAGRVRDPRLDAIIDENIEALVKEDSERPAPTSDQLKGESLVKSSQQASGRSPPNEPTRSAEPNTGPTLNTYPTDKKGFSLVWILLSAFVAAFALTIIVLIFRSPSKNTSRGDVK